MSALIDPKPGDVVETPDGRLRICHRRGDGVYGMPGEVSYRVSKQPRAKNRSCWITTWREWCKKNKAVEVVS